MKKGAGYRPSQKKWISDSLTDEGYLSVMNPSIAIIGAGNLGTAIAEGLLASGYAAPQHLLLSRRNTAPLQALADRGVIVTTDNNVAVAGARMIILAVKPFQAEEVIRGLLPVIGPGQVVVSVVTGLSLSQLQALFGEGIPLFRAMPNTAIAVRESMTCLSHSGADAGVLAEVQALFGHLGRVALIDDKLMDAATVLGACGTAYAMRYIRANIQGGIEIGFDAATASLIAAQTVKGATELLLQRGAHPEQEIDKVTTPRGCTIAGLNEMEHQGFSSSLIKGIAVSFERIAGSK